jgi:hypothetical protein
MLATQGLVGGMARAGLILNLRILLRIFVDM